MGKAARNRKIRKEALETKLEHPSFRKSPKSIARKERRRHGH